MNSFELTVENNEYFFYRRGNIKTNKIWTRPTYEKIRKLLEIVKSDSKILDDYKMYLIGGVLFSFENTWDVDLCLTGKIKSFNELERDMNFMYEIALNELQLLIDIQWMNDLPPIITYDQLNTNNFLECNLKYLKTTYIIKKTKNIESMIDLRNCENIKKRTEFLVEGYHENYPTSEPKIVNKIFHFSNKILKTGFSVEEFLDTNKIHFYKNTNRF